MTDPGEIEYDSFQKVSSEKSFSRPVSPGPRGEVDEVATARRNSIFFSVDHETGRLEIDERLAPLATTFKERAAFTKRLLLAALPAGPYAHQYLLFDLVNGYGRLLTERPGADLHEAQLLWDGLQDHYSGELKQPVAVTREDWPRIDAEWDAFYRRLVQQAPPAGADRVSQSNELRSQGQPGGPT